MSGGSIGKGVHYWATIKISGNLKKKQLQQIKKEINKVLKSKVGRNSVKGSIKREKRARDKDGYSFDSKRRRG
jgi:hypothetical protein